MRHQYPNKRRSTWTPWNGTSQRWLQKCQKTIHGSRLWILAQHQFYQRPPPRAHQQDQHQRNIPNKQIVYSNTNTMYSNTRGRKLSTRNTKQDLRRYVTWLQATSRNSFYWHTTTASLDFFLSVLFSSWTTFESTIDMSYQNTNKTMILHWMHNGTRLLPSKYCSLAFNTEKYFPKLEKSHSLRKISFALHTFPSKTLDCSTFHVIPGETRPQASKIGVTSRSYLPKRQKTSNITPLDQSYSMMKLKIISYNWAKHLQHNSKK